MILHCTRKASEASERHAKSLARATWALVGATVVLVIITGIHVWALTASTPQEQAKRDVARCMEVARLMLGHLKVQPPLDGVQANMAYRCLMRDQQ